MGIDEYRSPLTRRDVVLGLEHARRTEVPMERLGPELRARLSVDENDRHRGVCGAVFATHLNAVGKVVTVVAATGALGLPLILLESLVGREPPFMKDGKYPANKY